MDIVTNSTAVLPPLRRPTSAWIAVILALLVEQIAMWWLYYHDGGKQLVGDEVYYMQTARSILDGAVWHTSTIWPPGQSLLIAILGANLLAVQALQMLLFFGCAALVRAIWRRCSGNAQAAMFAALLFVLNPSDAAYAQYLWPEIPHVFALLLALYLLSAYSASTRAAGAAGLSVAVALLFKSLLTAFWPLLLLCFVTSWRPMRVNWRPACVFVVTLLLGIAPALIAGHRNSGHWSIADSSMFNLLAGLSDRARNDYVDEPVAKLFDAYQRSGASVDERNAWARSQTQRLLAQTSLPVVLERQLGRQYFRLLEAKTLMLTQLPGAACEGYLGAYRPVPQPVDMLVHIVADIFHIVILCGFAFGLVLWRNWRSGWLWIGLALLGYQLALYSGLHVKARYLLPMVPLFCCFAGETLAAIVQRRNDSLVFTPLRLAAGGAFAALLMWLAFAGPWLDGYCNR